MTPLSGDGKGSEARDVIAGDDGDRTWEDPLRFAATLSDQWVRGRLEAEQRALRMGIPVRREVEGQIKELQFFRDGMPYYYVTNNLEAAITISTRPLWMGGGGGYDLNGSSETLGVWDSGRVLLSHQEFGGRVSQIDAASDNSNHATHVAGTMVASGVASQARGMSGSARLHAYDWNDDLSEMLLAASQGLRVSNHSYGYITGWHWAGNIWRWYGRHDESEAWGFGFYDQGAQMWDQLAWAMPYYLPVKAAGNSRGAGPFSQPVVHEVMIGGQWVRDSTTIRQVGGGADGFDCLPFNSVSKNILTVGAVYNIQGGYNEAGDVIMSSFSSWGPTDDGRVKPDLVASGVGLYSSSSAGETMYTSMSGTSMAAPNVSGSIGLLLQLYRNIHGNDSILAATMKALLIHTADEAGDGPGPDYRHGWGLMNTHSAASLLSLDRQKGKHFLLREKTLHQGESISIPVFATGEEPLKATIAWTDPPGTPLPPQLNPEELMLVNDLDVRIIRDSDSHTYHPFVLDPAHPAMPATTGDNFRDNVEKVMLADAEAGELYWLEISHKETLSGGQQDFSLILSGVSAATTFVGPGDEWNEASHWSHGVPDSSHSIIIPEGVELVLKGEVQCRNMLIRDNASLSLYPTARLSAEGSLLTGGDPGRLVLHSTEEGSASLIHHTEDVALTVHTYLEGDWPSPMGQWHLLSAPVSGQSAGDLIPPWEEGEYYFYHWEETSAGWLDFPGNGNAVFSPGQGYLASWDNNYTPAFSGTAGAGDILLQDMTLTPDQGEGWHLLGNPFTSGMTWDATLFELEEVAHTAKLWRQGGYVDLISSEGYIPSAKGFFVQTTSSQNSLRIPAAARRHPPEDEEGQGRIPAGENRIVLQAKGQDSPDLQMSMIRFVPGASPGFDPRYEARFLQGHGPVFHALKGPETLSTIAFGSGPEDLRVYYQFSKTITEESFEISLLENDTGQPTYLFDRLHGTVKDLSSGEPYSFESHSQEYPWPRFEIHISSSLLPTSTDEPGADVLAEAWHHQGRIYLKHWGTPLGVGLFDLLGQKLHRHTWIAGDANSIGAPTTPGLYLLRFEAREGTQVLRIVIP